MVALLCSLSLLLAQPVPDTLKPQLKTGQEFRFQASGEMTFAGEKATLTTVYKVKILEVRPDGSFLVESTETESKAKMGGRDITMPPKRPGRTLYGPDGAPTSLMGDGADAVGYRLANLNAFRYPAEPVAVGAKWTATVTAMKTGQVAATCDYEYLGAETIGAWKCGKVRFAYRETEGTSPAQGEGWFWISLDDGWIVKAVRSIKNAPLGASPAPVDTTSLVERVG